MSDKGDSHQEFILSKFVEWVSEFRDLECLITDQGTTEELVHRIFSPSCKAMLCTWHIKKKNLKENLKKVPESDYWITFIVQHLIEAKTEEEYDSNYENLHQEGPDPVFSYYSRNLHPFRHRFSQPWRLRGFTAGFQASGMYPSTYVFCYIYII